MVSASGQISSREVELLGVRERLIGFLSYCTAMQLGAGSHAPQTSARLQKRGSLISELEVGVGRGECVGGRS